MVLRAAGTVLLPTDDRAREFRDLLGEVVDLTFETSKGRPCLPLPPGWSDLICTTHETGIF